MSEWLTYSRYYTAQDAENVLQLLRQQKIPFQLKHDKGLLDKIYIGDAVEPLVLLQVNGADFEQVNMLLQKDAAQYLTSLPPDYYLLHFSVDELKDVLKHPNDWNAFDTGIATVLLKRKGIKISEEATEESVPVPYAPLEIQPLILLLQYLMSAVILFAGIIIGLSTLFAYKTLSDGKRVPMFNKAAFGHAKIFIALGIVRLLIFGYWVITS